MLNQQTRVWFSGSAHPCNLKEVYMHSLSHVLQLTHVIYILDEYPYLCGAWTGHVLYLRRKFLANCKGWMCPCLADTTCSGIDGVFLREECSFGSYCSTEQGHLIMRLCRSWWVTKLSFFICIITSCGIRVYVANSPMDVQCRVNESGESGADHH